MNDRKYLITVTIRDDNEPTFITIRNVEIDYDDYFILKSYRTKDYDAAWERLINQLDGSDLPRDWYIDHIKFGGMYE